MQTNLSSEELNTKVTLYTVGGLISVRNLVATPTESDPTLQGG